MIWTSQVVFRLIFGGYVGEYNKLTPSSFLSIAERVVVPQWL